MGFEPRTYCVLGHAAAGTVRPHGDLGHPAQRMEWGVAVLIPRMLMASGASIWILSSRLPCLPQGP